VPQDGRNKLLASKHMLHARAQPAAQLREPVTARLVLLARGLSTAPVAQGTLGVALALH